MQIEIANNAEKFKNWFFGRVPAELEHANEPEFSELPIHLQSEDNLPVEGNPNAKYFVADTGDTYRFIDGAYQVIDVYSYGVTQEYRDKPRRVISKVIIEDPSFTFPSIPEGKILGEDHATMATLFNIHALVTDLEQIRRIHVEGNKTTLMDVISTGHLDKAENATRWFATHHKLLYRLLVSTMRSKTMFNKKIIDAMAVHSYVLTWDDSKNRPVFKVADFTVYI